MNKEWNMEKKYMQHGFSSLLERNIMVNDIENFMIGELGYTKGGNVIHVAYEHKIFQSLENELKKVFRLGIGVHEILHLVFTDFVTYNSTIKKFNQKYSIYGDLKGYEKHGLMMFKYLFNVLEDAAIENFANQIIGGSYLKALRFQTMHICQNPKNIQDSDTALNQVLSAIYDFSNIGIIKGNFTYDEAGKHFAEILPLLHSGILEPNPSIRIDIAMKITFMLSPLWKKENAKEELLNTLNDYSNNTNGFAEGETESSFIPNKATDMTTKEKGRLLTEQLLENAFGSKQNQLDEINTSNLEVSKSDEKGDMKQSTPNSKECSSTDNKETEKQKQNKNDSKGDLLQEPDLENDLKTEHDELSALDMEHNKETEMQKQNKTDSNEELLQELEHIENELKTEHNELSTLDVERIINEIDSFINDTLKNNDSDTSNSINNDSFSVNINREDVMHHTVFKNATCLNNIVQINPDHYDTMLEEYNKLTSTMRTSIKSLQNRMKRIFLNNAEDKEYRETGRINQTKLYGSRVTARVCTKRVTPTNVSDMAVVIAVDESGSMQANANYQKAKIASIALAESLAIFPNIPLYIFGFTADTMGYNCVHNHYLTGKNTLSNRCKLLNITYRANNFDGYSVRYATELIKKVNASHKLLIVISDGQPICKMYNSYQQGISDTTQAIHEASKRASVLGVGIRDNIDILHRMYGSNFLCVTETNDLFSSIANRLEKIVRSW